jgi:non-ribosomal peptide synthetase component F
VLLLEQGISMVTTILAVLKAGRFFVPVDPTDPESRTIQILQGSGTRFIITNSDNLTLATGLMSASGNICLNLDEVPANLDGTDLSLDIAPGALAYILYTSVRPVLPRE